MRRRSLAPMAEGVEKGNKRKLSALSISKQFQNNHLRDQEKEPITA